MYFLEGAEPKSLEFKKSGSASYGVASFVKNGRKLDAIWSDIELSASSITELNPLFSGRKAFDMMGNPIESNAELRLSAAPIYLLEE